MTTTLPLDGERAPNLLQLASDDALYIRTIAANHAARQDMDGKRHYDRLLRIADKLAARSKPEGAEKNQDHLAACGRDRVQAWQSVETLPPEGLPVLVYTPPQPGDYPDTVNIDFDFICPDYEDWHNHCENYEHYMAVGGSNACGPDVVCTGPGQKALYTHWMPLPAAPAKDAP